jgi:hypothetical protein
MAIIKKAPKAQIGRLLKKGAKEIAEKAVPKIETSTMKNVVKNAGREDLRAKMKQWDTDLLKGKKKMKNGGSLSGLKASNKRVGPVDPKGAFTAVQKKTLAGAKGKASLTKDKQLGATKMAKRGMSVKKK